MVVVTLRPLLTHVPTLPGLFLVIRFHDSMGGQSLAWGAQLRVSGQHTMSSGLPVGEGQQVPSSHTVPKQAPTLGWDLESWVTFSKMLLR